MGKWLRLWWYIYLLKDNTGIDNIICRAKGHEGIVFYNPSGLEPDYHCKNCGEFLG